MNQNKNNEDSSFFKDKFLLISNVLHQKNFKLYLSFKRKTSKLYLAFFVVIIGLITGIGAFFWYVVISIQQDDEWKRISKAEFISTYNNLVTKNNIVTKNNLISIYNEMIESSNSLTDLDIEKMVDSLKMIIDTGRLSENDLNNQYLEKQEFNNLVKIGRLSKFTLSNTYVQKNEFNSIYDIVNNGRLSEDNLDSTYLQNTQFQTLNDIVNNGRLSENVLLNRFLSLNYLNSWSPNDFNIQNNAVIKNNLIIDGEAELSKDLKVEKNTMFLGDVYVGRDADPQSPPSYPENLSNLIVVGETVLNGNVNVNENIVVGDVNNPLANFNVVGTSNLLGDVAIGNSNNLAFLSVKTITSIKGELNARGNTFLGSLGADSVLNLKGVVDDTSTTFLGKLDLTEANVIGFPYPTNLHNLVSSTLNENSYNQLPSFVPTHSEKFRLDPIWDTDNLYFLISLNIEFRLNNRYAYHKGDVTKSFFIDWNTIYNVTSNSPYTKTFNFDYVFYDGNKDIVSVSSGQYNLIGSSKIGMFKIANQIQVRIFVENGIKYIQLKAPSDPQAVLKYFIGRSDRSKYEELILKQLYSNIKLMKANLILFKA